MLINGRLNKFTSYALRSIYVTNIKCKLQNAINNMIRILKKGMATYTYFVFPYIEIISKSIYSKLKHCISWWENTEEEYLAYIVNSLAFEFLQQNTLSCNAKGRKRWEILF